MYCSQCSDSIPVDIPLECHGRRPFRNGVREVATLPHTWRMRTVTVFV